MKIKDYPVIFPRDPYKQARYELMIEAGESGSLAEMCAAQQAPGIGMTTSIFMQGKHDGGISDPEHAERYRRIARENGVNPEGKMYCSGLASFPGDPTAWVNTVKEAKDHADVMGLKLEGGINHTPPEWEEPAGDDNIEFSNKKYVAADDLVSDEMEMEAENNPELIDEWKAKPATFEEAKNTIKERLSGR